MAKIVPDNEILEFALAREIEAYHFYMALAKKMERPEISRLFEELAREELEHKENLELEIIKTGKTLAEVQENIAASIPNYITSPEDSRLDMEYKDVLMLAMEKEEASFRTYVRLLGTVKDEQSREMLLAIAEEEVRHKLRFEMEYNMLLKNG